MAGGNSIASTNGSGIGQYPSTQDAQNICNANLTDKYLNFGLCTNSNNATNCGLNTGFYVTPHQGASLIISIQICTGDDNPPRDPITIIIEGSNSSGAFLPIGSGWTLIYNGTSGLDVDPGDCSDLYGQCDGINWTGPKQCCGESKCIFQNNYYSQCLPSSGGSGSSSNTPHPETTPSPSNTGRKNGVTTRYWDCCKASCGWAGKASVTNPVKTCVRNGITQVDVNAQSGCNGGSAYMCNNQQPWNVSSTLSYGYAAAYITGQRESDWCCACYSLIFTTGPVAGKELIVQVTNTGGDLGENHFDLQMPGGGVGIFDGCSSQFPDVSKPLWGQQYGGISQRSQCNNLPAVLRSGCFWRFDWFQNADNPKMNFKEVSCPAALTANTQCVRR
ncbi:unnamed protein product [Rotaria sp. Silwood1]|nr:unnamed protein product [Rotaria sp. Silwood1]CAF3810048.1 unnamed protein product [Rotaria sp. Silwood1]CAF4704919.1 unnamed protein product [Rotaria sp. Silwood1]CAF5003137.1 unnamed protein product [Rotaria sp. Silwood1]